MSTVVINGIEQPYREGVNLTAIVTELIDAPRGVAVAVDREVVPRSQWDTTFPAPGAQIEVVAAAAGG